VRPRVAKVRAKQLVDGHDVELWERARHIATFKRTVPRQQVRSAQPGRTSVARSGSLLVLGIDDFLVNFPA
jgi:hypothetical protein